MGARSAGDRSSKKSSSPEYQCRIVLNECQCQNQSEREADEDELCVLCERVGVFACLRRSQ